MDEHAEQVLVRRQWGVCVRETYTCWPFEPFSKYLCNEIYLCLIAPVSQGVLACIRFAVHRSCQCGDTAPAGLAGCRGEALQRECPEVPGRKSSHACVGTRTLREFRYLPPVWSLEALGIYTSPFCSKVWLNVLWQWFPFLW